MKTFPLHVLYMSQDDVGPRIIQNLTRYVVFTEITLMFFLFFHHKGSQEMLETNVQQLLNFHPSQEWFMDLSLRSRPIPASIATSMSSMSSRPAPVLMHLSAWPGHESTLPNIIKPSNRTNIQTSLLNHLPTIPSLL
jgi:hypothetical protein